MDKKTIMKLFAPSIIIMILASITGDTKAQVANENEGLTTKQQSFVKITAFTAVGD